MNYLFTHTDEDIFKNPEFSVPDEYRKRVTVKSITINDKGEYGFVTNTVHGFYLLAGGGAESEDLEAEIKRECDEEMNIEVEVLKKIGVVHEYRNRNAREYETTCFFVRAIGELLDDTRTEDEKYKGLFPVWVSEEKAVKIIKEQQKKVLAGEVAFYNTAFDMLRDARFFMDYLHHVDKK
jgi:ADP-ribose pyrophosphatase YjhB (NUDIX family)